MTKDNILTWLTINRKKIGYTIGILNILFSLNFLLRSEIIYGIVWLFIGITVIFDSWSMP